MTTKIKIVSKVPHESVWEGDSFTQFKVSKVTNKAGKIWIYYFNVFNPKEKFFCLEGAFLQRFHQLTNLY